MIPGLLCVRWGAPRPFPPRPVLLLCCRSGRLLPEFRADAHRRPRSFPRDTNVAQSSQPFRRCCNARLTPAASVTWSQDRCLGFVMRWWHERGSIRGWFLREGRHARSNRSVMDGRVSSLCVCVARLETRWNESLSPWLLHAMEGGCAVGLIHSSSRRGGSMSHGCCAEYPPTSVLPRTPRTCPQAQATASATVVSHDAADSVRLRSLLECQGGW